MNICTPPEGENTSGKPASVSGGGSSGLSIGARPADAPGANLTPEEVARRASGHGTHRRASKPVSYWIPPLSVPFCCIKFIPNSGWLLVHIVTLGLITNSILIWSQHFTKRHENQNPLTNTVALRCAASSSCAGIALMVGMIGQPSIPGLYAATVVGALIVGAIAWHAL